MCLLLFRERGCEGSRGRRGTRRVGLAADSPAPPSLFSARARANAVGASSSYTNRVTRGARGAPSLSAHITRRECVDSSRARYSPPLGLDGERALAQKGGPLKNLTSMRSEAHSSQATPAYLRFRNHAWPFQAWTRTNSPGVVCGVWCGGREARKKPRRSREKMAQGGVAWGGGRRRLESNGSLLPMLSAS